MSIMDKIKIAGHGVCCGAYAMLFSGYHLHYLYLLVAVAYAALTISELKR